MKLSNIALLLTLSATSLLGCNPSDTQKNIDLVRPVKLIKADNLINPHRRSFPARIEANQKADLAFRISGELTTLPLLEGQEVSKGNVLAELDSRDAKNNLLLREADFELSDADYRRKKELYTKKLISKAEYDTAKAKLKSAQANLASARDQLSYTKLLAPFSGVVASRIIDNYQTVQAGQTILSLHRNDVVDVVIQVPESFVQEVNAKLKSGIKFSPSVKFTAYPSMSYPVTFKESSTQVSSGTQSYKTAFVLKQPEEFDALPGMSAELSIDFSSTNFSMGTMVLPASAIGMSDNSAESIVWLFDNSTGTVNSSVVTLGQVRSNGIEVLNGISPGDQVVAVGVQHLKEGMRVKPLKWERGV
ncbi:efflux RND transporter periplasmic adaptor subunit [Vibrio sp. HN007]|uniref:efflux RND transporter periplasmic adaptor subunit n=1 Tax=Vibrio iocasae TaxID=3098914 RepID=UPI0035D3FC32